jgi:hypothetical protein
VTAGSGPTGMPANPFVREGHVDKPGIVGSHWWNRELGEATKLQTRRGLITALAVSAAGIGTLGFFAFQAAGDDTRQERRPSLEMQRTYGWNFGATSENVALDNRFTTSYAAEALPRLATDLLPRNQNLVRWYIPTLFQSPSALPRLTLPEPEPGTPQSLAAALRPIHTASMVRDEIKAEALAKLLAQATGGRVALVFDLEGPESVAAAAGAADLYEPVFLFDNWPHPRGVVPAHLALAAAVYHQPRFVQAAGTRPAGAPPAFILDRNRLSVYHDDTSQFDNRWLARLPSAQDLRALEIKRVLYVVPTKATPIDLRDVGQIFHDWSTQGIDVRALAMEALVADVTTKTASFGPTPEAHAGFFGHYPWKSPAPPPVPVPLDDVAASWRPHPPASDPADETLGTILVAVEASTALVLGPQLLRSGSWNRSSGGWGG